MSVSKSSRNYLLLVLAALVQGVFGHTYLSSLYLGDQALAEGDCMRPHPQTAYDYPIPLVDQADMTCGWLPAANRAANRKCPVSAGSKIGLQWWHTSPGDDVVEATHAGPLMIYLAKSETGSGNVWFKVYEDGFRDGAWAVDRLLANRGRVDFTLPTDIEPGNYLLRGEILALHGAYALNGVQPYVGCAELTISGNGNAKPAGVAIPGVYKNTDSGMLFSRYQPFSVYNIPGPAVYKSGSSSSGSNNNAAPSTSAPTVAPPATAPTSRPTYAPVTSAPTYPPSNNNNNNNNNANTIKVGLNGGSSVWWVGAIVSGGAETTVKVEMMDNGAVKNWVAMKDEGYAYTYNNGVQLVTPISLRVTSSTGKQVVLTNIFSSFSTGNSLIDTGKTYSSPSNPSTTAPTEKPTQKPTSAPVTSAPVTSAPVTSAPVTSAPTQKPTNAPSGNAKITFLSGASEWWFAVSISADVSSVEVKDSSSYTSYKALASDKWGQDTVYSFSTSGAPLVTPISVKVTSKSGKVSTATVSSISANTVVELGSL